MSDLIYFNEKRLRLWIQLLREGESRKYLPEIDEEWYARIMDSVNLIQLPGYEKNIYAQAAHLFYKINHGHKFPNGNKRSAIVVFYLLCIENWYVPRETHIFGQSGIRKLAKRVARSSGRRSEFWIKEIEKEFREILVKFGEGSD